LELKDSKTALQAIRTATGIMAEARQYLKLRGELSGELGRAGQVQVGVHQQVLQIMTLPRWDDPPEAWGQVDVPEIDS
jgi:hypothetical protein